MNLTPDSKVIIQGTTISPSLTHAVVQMKTYGTRIVACVCPGQGGRELSEIPIFDLVEQVITNVGEIDISVIFVHPYQVLDAALEAMAAGIRQLIIVTEGMPPLDMVHLVRKAEITETLVVGPNCSGIIIPDKLLLGTHPVEFYQPGNVGLLSRSSTLTYEVAAELTQGGLGQSVAVSIGSDFIVGSSFLQWLEILDEDENTDVIVLVGEMGGTSEEEAASYIAESIDTPVIAYVAGLHAPTTKLLGHASLLMTSKVVKNMVDPGTVESKVSAFKNAEVLVAKQPSEIPILVKKVIKKHKK